MIKAYCKRVLLFLPYVLCYFLALGIAMLALVMYASEFLFENNTDSIVSVACYVPMTKLTQRSASPSSRKWTASSTP